MNLALFFEKQSGFLHGMILGFGTFLFVTGTKWFAGALLIVISFILFLIRSNQIIEGRACQ